MRKPDLYDGIVGLSVVFYAAFFSYLSLFRLNAFQLEYDFAIFHQAFLNTIYHGGLFTNSLENASHFGIHFSPVLFSLLPLYAISPGPHVLLIAQSVLLGLGAIPIYLCGREILGKKAGLMISCTYLLYPSLHGVNIYDFHEVAFLPLLLGLTLFCYVTDRKNAMVLFGLLSLLVKEDVAVIIGMIGIIGLFRTRGREWSDRWQYIALSGMAAVILATFLFIIRPAFAPDGNLISGQIAQYLSPAENLGMYNENRIIYLLMTFIPLLFIPLLAPEIMAISIPSFLEILLSQSPYYYSVFYQYSALVIPVLFIATIRGLVRIKIREEKSGKKIIIPLLCIILISTLICSFVYSPAATTIRINGDIDEKAMNEHREFLIQILSIIPEEASISTQFNLLPYVTNHHQIWADYQEQADIILIDGTFPNRAADFNDDAIKIEEHFLPVITGDNIYLFVNKNSSKIQTELARRLQLPLAG